MWAEDYKWHYDYVRLAWDTGFSFDKCKSPNLDKNKICLVDVDRIVRERDVASVDRYICTVVQYVLDDEQAKVLDINFVKIFRLSQLAVEFLLFCKKYLDNTVVLLKRELNKFKEENKELKTCIDDLQSHVDTLSRQQALATFKCSICSKAFSSEVYVNAHVKRRHNNHNSESYNVETDKLNLEIKQLKERLNNTEKLLKDKEEQSYEKVLHNSGNNSTKMDTLLEKFEHFKVKVDIELKELKMQKSFYEENYGRLFDLMINSKENIEPKFDIKDIGTAETTTQTDKVLHIDNVYNKNVLEIQEPYSISNSKAKHEVLYKEENSLKETKENLEAKISTTLAGIEDQMQAFWNKLNEIERTQTAAVIQSDLILDQAKDIITSENTKPKIKPRSKLSQPTHNTMVTADNVETLKLAISKLEQEQKFEHKETQNKHNEALVDKNLDSVARQHKPIITNILPETILTEDLSDSSESEEESLLENQTSESESPLEAQKKAVLITPSVSVLGKQSIASFNKISFDKEVLKKLNKEIQEVMFSRIQELGISKSWSGIPQRSFEKSLEILNHQAALTKRTYSNFDLLKKKINGEVEKQCARKTSSKIQLKTTPKKQKIKEAQNIVKISYRPKSNKTRVNQRTVTSKREIVEIKNRALYGTDTESEKNFKASCSQVVGASQPHQMYTDVVNEFKSLTSAKLLKDQDSDMDDFHQKEDLQKGVLKSFPSVGSLSKKKVLFDLANDFRKWDNAPVVQKTGGSTTSVASSILEHSIKGADDLVNYEEKDKTRDKENEKSKIKENFLNDVSDDFSDL